MSLMIKACTCERDILTIKPSATLVYTHKHVNQGIHPICLPERPFSYTLENAKIAIPKVVKKLSFLTTIHGLSTYVFKR
jgi:hypothetical protein